MTAYRISVWRSYEPSARDAERIAAELDAFCIALSDRERRLGGMHGTQNEPMDDRPSTSAPATVEELQRLLREQSFVVMLANETHDLVNYSAGGLGRATEVSVTLQVDLCTNPDLIRSILALAIDHWDATEAAAYRWKLMGEDRVWLHWLRDGTPPVQTKRTIPDGSDAKTKAYRGGILYQWPENAFERLVSETG